MLINCVSEGLKKSKTFWTSALVEAGAAQETGSCIPSMIIMPYHKWEGSLFTLALLHFILVKVKELPPQRVNFLCLLFSFKNVM